MNSTQIGFLPPCPGRERPNIVPSRSVCKQLFGPVNHEQLKADLLREKRKLCEEATQTWNFDFENEIPLVGRYVWKSMRSNWSRERLTSSFSTRVSETESNERSDLPSSAERPNVTSTTTTSLGTTNRAIPISDDMESEYIESGKCDPEKSSSHLRKKKSTEKITDFLRSKKQRTSVKEIPVKRSRPGRRKSTSKQRSIDLFVHKH